MWLVCNDVPNISLTIETYKQLVLLLYLLLLIWPLLLLLFLLLLLLLLKEPLPQINIMAIINNMYCTNINCNAPIGGHVHTM